jgi:hypothetical protein
VWNWSSYYCADGYLVKELVESFFELEEDDFATVLNLDPLDLLNLGFGTKWQEVQSFDLNTSLRWFVQGDPWNALLGVGDESVVVSGLDLSTDGLAGPGTLTAHKPQFQHEKSDLSGIYESILKVRKSMQKRWRRCENCQSPRLDDWDCCSCESPISGIRYD